MCTILQLIIKKRYVRNKLKNATESVSVFLNRLKLTVYCEVCAVSKTITLTDTTIVPKFYKCKNYDSRKEKDTFNLLFWKYSFLFCVGEEQEKRQYSLFCGVVIFVGFLHGNRILMTSQIRRQELEKLYYK
jgi:hypothetical protein